MPGNTIKINNGKIALRNGKVRVGPAGEPCCCGGQCGCAGRRPQTVTASFSGVDIRRCLKFVGYYGTSTGNKSAIMELDEGVVFGTFDLEYDEVASDSLQCIWSASKLVKVYVRLLDCDANLTAPGRLACLDSCSGGAGVRDFFYFGRHYDRDGNLVEAGPQPYSVNTLVVKVAHAQGSTGFGLNAEVLIDDIAFNLQNGAYREAYGNRMLLFGRYSESEGGYAAFVVPGSAGDCCGASSAASGFTQWEEGGLDGYNRYVFNVGRGGSVALTPHCGGPRDGREQLGPVVAMNPTASNLAVCHRCPRRQRPCAGSCDCEADPQRRDIAVTAAANDCPLGKFGGGRRHALTVHPAYVFDRQAACRPCEHRRGDRCGLLTARGLAGLLMHPTRGIPAAGAKCPDQPPRWGPA